MLCESISPIYNHHLKTGALRSELRKKTSNGNFFVRVYVPGCVYQETDLHWNCKDSMPQFNWRLKFRVVLNLASACWGSGDVTPMRIQLMDRVGLCFDSQFAHTTRTVDIAVRSISHIDGIYRHVFYLVSESCSLRCTSGVDVTVSSTLCTS